MFVGIWARFRQVELARLSNLVGIDELGPRARLHAESLNDYEFH